MPFDFFWHLREEIHVIAEVFVVPIVARLIGEDIGVILMDFEAVVGVFDDDGF